MSVVLLEILADLSKAPASASQESQTQPEDTQQGGGFWNFPYHRTVGHVLPALPMYFFGLYLFLKHFKVLRKSEATTGEKESETFTKLMIAIGVVYSLIHYWITFTASTTSVAMKNWTHSFIGTALIVCGILRIFLSKPEFNLVCVDFSMPLAFALVGVALAFHLDNDMEANTVHITFATSMISTGIATAIASIKPRYTIVQGTLCILSCSLLSVASDDIIDWGHRSYFGAANLILFSVFFALFHLAAVLLYVKQSGRLPALQEYRKLERGSNSKSTAVDVVMEEVVTSDDDFSIMPAERPMH